MVFSLEILKATDDDRERRIIPRLFCRVAPNQIPTSWQASSHSLRVTDKDFSDRVHPLSASFNMRNLYH